MMKLHGCSTAAPATSFALPCAELLARQRACTARATRLALVSARSRIAAALRVTPVCRIVAAHEHVRHRPVMCMYKTNFLSELQSQTSFSIDPTRNRVHKSVAGTQSVPFLSEIREMALRHIGIPRKAGAFA